MYYVSLYNALLSCLYNALLSSLHRNLPILPSDWLDVSACESAKLMPCNVGRKKSMPLAWATTRLGIVRLFDGGATAVECWEDSRTTTQFSSSRSSLNRWVRFHCRVWGKRREWGESRIAFVVFLETRFNESSKSTWKWKQPRDTKSLTGSTHLTKLRFENDFITI